MFLAQISYIEWDKKLILSVLIIYSFDCFQINLALLLRCFFFLLVIRFLLFNFTLVSSENLDEVLPMRDFIFRSNFFNKCILSVTQILNWISNRIFCWKSIEQSATPLMSRDYDFHAYGRKSGSFFGFSSPSFYTYAW